MRETISLKKCSGYDPDEVMEKVTEALELLGGVSRFVSPGERILIKPNLLTAKPVDAAVTTHPSLVRALIRLVQKAGGTPFVGDSPAIGTAQKVAERCEILDVCEAEGVEFTGFDEAVVVDNPEGHIFKRLEVARAAISADGIINVAKLKTHAQMLLTMGVKNIFGCVPGKRKPQWHLSAGVDTSHFANMILDLYLFIKPRLTVMDAVIAMEGNGPASGEPRTVGLIAAGEDALGVDALCARILGVEAEEVPILAAAIERGLRGARLNSAKILGDAPELFTVKNFKLPPLVHTRFTEGLPSFLGKGLRKSLTARPHIIHSKCTHCDLCVGVCPARIMTSASRIKIDYDKCIRCFCCQEMCPNEAITSKSGFLKKIIPGL
ncbi:MAG: DUF362 domain-containing protein [Thermodesulfobacteriota bacterium]